MPRLQNAQFQDFPVPVFMFPDSEPSIRPWWASGIWYPSPPLIPKPGNQRTPSPSRIKGQTHVDGAAGRIASYATTSRRPLPRTCVSRKDYQPDTRIENRHNGRNIIIIIIITTNDGCASLLRKHSRRSIPSCQKVCASHQNPPSSAVLAVLQVGGPAVACPAGWR